MSDTEQLGGFFSSDSNYDSIKYALQASYDYFDYFWRGRGRLWDSTARRPRYITTRVPKTRTRPPPGSRPGRDQRVWVYREFGKLRGRLDRSRVRAEIEQQIQQGYFPVKAALDPLDVRIIKPLGRGGQAVAVLAELVGDGGQREKVVIKAQKPERSSLAAEIACMDVSIRLFWILA